MSVTDEDLSAFSDGALTPEKAERVAALVSADPALARRVERMRAATAALRSAFDGVLTEGAPSRFTALLNEQQSERGRVIPFPALRRREIWAAAAAACFALAFVGGRLSAPSQSITMAEGRLRAGGALEQALDMQASGTEGRVRIALSFEAKDGGFCRVFDVDHTSAGLACSDDGHWTIVALANTQPASNGDGYAQAAGAMPRAILEAADARRTGDPLDADGEAQAIRTHWRD